MQSPQRQMANGLVAVQSLTNTFGRYQFVLDMFKSGEGHDNLLQYSCLGNPMDRGAWEGPWGHKESAMTEQLSTHFKAIF